MDVLCGRGKGIRDHPGNLLYNKLLRERYEEYAHTPKGSKLTIVNIVVNTIRNQQQLNGGGRFLEQKQQQQQQQNSDSSRDSEVYIDIGDVRALNKTVSTLYYLMETKSKKRHSSHIISFLFFSDLLLFSSSF